MNQRTTITATVTAAAVKAKARDFSGLTGGGSSNVIQFSPVPRASESNFAFVQKIPAHLSNTKTLQKFSARVNGRRKRPRYDGAFANQRAGTDSSTRRFTEL